MTDTAVKPSELPCPPEPRVAEGAPTSGPGLAARLAKKVGGSALLIVCSGLAGVMLVPSLLGYQRYVITGGSMSGTIDRGSIAYDELVPSSSLEVGDVITYQPPPGSGPTGLVTHRIVWVGRDKEGKPSFGTKGDANAGPDPWRFVLKGPVQARVVFHVPYIGYAFAGLSDKRIRMLVIGLPAALIALSVLAGIWRDAGRAGADGDAEESDETAEGSPA